MDFAIGQASLCMYKRIGMKMKGQIWKTHRKQSGWDSLIGYLWKFRESNSKGGMTPRFLVWRMFVLISATINIAKGHVY